MTNFEVLNEDEISSVDGGSLFSDVAAWLAAQAAEAIREMATPQV